MLGWLVLPDRAPPDRSREAGLNDEALNCTGVRSIETLSNTLMASRNAAVVKGNCGFVENDRR
jgi:hypothetical protein